MRKRTFIIDLLVVLTLVAFGASCAQAQQAIVKWREGQAEEGTERRIGFRYPVPTQEQSLIGFVASSSIEVGTTVAVKCPTLQVTTRVLLVGTLNDALNWGNSSVPAATYPFSIASGSYKAFNVATTTPNLYFRGQVASATVHLLEY